MRLRKQVYIYAGSYFLNAGLSFLTVSLLTQYLTAIDYGIINLYGAFITLLTPFITGGILYPLSIDYYKRDQASYQQFFTNAQAIPLISVFLFTFLCILFANPLSQFLRVSKIWILLLPLTAWWIMNNDIIMLICRLRNRPWRFAFFSIGKNLGEILITIGLVIGLKWAWQGRLFALVVTPIALGIFSLYLFQRWKLISPQIKWPQVKRIAWLSVPFIFERLTIFVLSNSDRYFIDKYDLNGTAEVGLYSVGAQLATIISLVILSANSAYQPFIFESLSGGQQQKARKATLLYIGAAALLILGMFAAIPIIFRFFIGKEFAGAMEYAYYLSAGYFMWAIYNAFLVYLLFNSKNRLVLYLSLTGMIVSLLLNFYMVTRYGAQGAAITSMVTYGVMAILTVSFSWKYFTVGKTADKPQV